MKRRIEESSDDEEQSDADVSEMSLDDTFVGDGITDIDGKIESLSMKNFMCHTNVELRFNRRINFLTGKNGSGKSAVMAALMVALGGTAMNLNRGTNITEFIKKGESRAVITLTMVNEGKNSYKPRVFGPRILIQRVVNLTGKHSYVFKSATGTIVSRKKEEVDRIVQHFNLQLKNPICILNQDVARSFLCTTSSDLRFSLFSSATQLDYLKKKYKNTLNKLAETNAKFLKKQRGVERARAEMKELKIRLKFFASLEERMNERTRLENEYVWALVTNEEENLKNLKQVKNELSEKKKEYLNEELEFEGKLKKLNGKLKQRQKNLESAVEEKNKKTIVKDEVQNQVRHFEKGFVKAETEMEFLTQKVDRQLAEINAMKNYILRCDKIESQVQAEREKLNKKVKVLQQRLSDIQKEKTRTISDLKEMEKNVVQSENLERLKRNLLVLEQNKIQLEFSLEEMKTKGQNNYAKFGYYTRELLRAIDEATKQNSFIRRPIGPCGMNVKLTGDPKWARSVEFAIGGLMTTYRCDNQKDFLALSKIMDEICIKKHPTMIIGKFLSTRHNVENKKVSVRGIQSVLDVLSFDNDVVFNTFVDHGQIERILLFESDEQAASILTNIQNVPRNVKMGLTLQGDQYYPAPNYRTYYGNSTRPLRYFGGASKYADAVKKLKIELRETNETIAKTNSELEKVREAPRETPALIEKYKRRLKHLKEEEGNIEVKLNQLKDMEEMQPVPVKKSALEEELKRLLKEHESWAEEKNQREKSFHSTRKTRNGLVIKLNEVATDEFRAGQKVAKLEGKLEKSRGKHKIVLERLEETHEKLKDITKRLKEIKESVRKSKAVVKQKIKAAEEVCPERVETSRSPDELKKLLEDCEKYIKAAKKMNVSLQDTIQEYKVKRLLFKKMKRMARKLKKSVEALKETSAEKKKNLKIVRSYTQSLVSLYFQAILRARGFEGQLIIDFKRQSLDLEVKPKDATIARTDTKTLSGGERSYCMVSFILAIWKVVNMPLYFLDEFDVFLDRMNRKVVLDLLIEHASTQSKKQFIFITPQDISDIEPSDIIAILKMPDPKRKSK